MINLESQILQTIQSYLPKNIELNPLAELI